MAERVKKQLSFEETMQELEDKVRELESGELSLEESLKAYEKAVDLIVQCRDALAPVQRENYRAEKGSARRDPRGGFCSQRAVKGESLCLKECLSNIQSKQSLL